jgi:ubiquinone/menaquinone biosynthesis C-methylase UbiE
MSLKEKVIQANIEVHSKLAQSYNTSEPHFRPENIKRVEEKLQRLVKQTSANRLLDLGCGTGFVIQIAKKMVKEIDGVDITQAMMDQVDLSGPAKIKLHKSDSGQFNAQAGHYDLVTSYSFLHHLFDITDTCKVAFKALRPGGVYYIDLDPNYYFWEHIKNLDANKDYDPVIKREIQSVSHRDEEIEAEFGVSASTFNHAEYSKNIAGGFKAESLEKTLRDAGFKKVTVFYNWFVGQGTLINDPKLDTKQRLQMADVMEEYLVKALPLSKHLFKYIGAYAEK